MDATFWQHVLNLLIEPSTTIKEEENRNQARILSAMLLLCMPLAILGAFFGYKPLFILFLILIPSYFFSRTKFFYIATGLTLISLISPSYLALINSPQSNFQEIGFLFSWCLIPHILTAIALSPIGAIILAIANLTGLVTLTILTPEITLGDSSAALGLIATTNILVVLTTALRNQYINERKQAESRLRQSLIEKEALLKEIHHRVKNNLQIVSSLLNLQIGEIEDPQTATPLRDSQARVRSMALIHEHLYQSPSLSEINMQDYLQDLSAKLAIANQYEGLVSPTIVVNAPEISLNIDQSIACGLIVTELVTNAFKHAFSGKELGQINVNLSSLEDDQFCLEVSDNGIGLPQEFDVNRTTSLGIQLVTTLTHQLEGNLELTGERGTTVRISF